MADLGISPPPASSSKAAAFTSPAVSVVSILESEGGLLEEPSSPGQEQMKGATPAQYLDSSLLCMVMMKDGKQVKADMRQSLSGFCEYSFDQGKHWHECEMPNMMLDPGPPVMEPAMKRPAKAMKKKPPEGQEGRGC